MAEPDGTLLGFAAWRSSWAVLDFYVRPGRHRQAVEEGIFAWASERFRALDDEPAYVMLSRTLSEQIPPPSPPDGFVLRSLMGVGEVAPYVTVHRRAFACTSMTTAWRTRTLRMPQHRPELDLVAIAPDGRMAGFCIGWFAPEQRAVQIEPTGVDPTFQRLGLGRALLFELFRRCQALGVEHVFVETESARWPARHAYEAAGFRPAYHSLRKGRWFSTA